MDSSSNRESDLVQPELAVDRADLRRLDQPRVGHRDREQRTLKLLEPEIEKFVQHREIGAEVVFLPNVGLQQRRVIGKPIQNVRSGQAIAFNLLAKVTRNHGVLHSSRTTLSWNRSSQYKPKK